MRAVRHWNRLPREVVDACYSFGPWSATKGHAVALLPLAPLGREGEWKGKGKKPVGQDKDSLTEQQAKLTVTTTILIRRIYKTNSEMHRATLTAWCPATQHDSTWYQIPCFVWPVWVTQPGCVPSQLLVKINPVVAEPRTLSTPYSLPSTSCLSPHFPVDHHHFSCL